MQAKIRKWGNSVAVRIPIGIATELGLYDDTTVNLAVENQSLVISRKKYDLDDLVAQITPENTHNFIDSGGPVGREVW